MAISKINVELLDRQYEILLGNDILQNAGALIANIISRKRVLIIADENAWRFHGQILADEIAAQNIEFEKIIVASGEASKSFASFERVCEAALEFGLERNDFIIAFGGGVVGDLTGFVAGVINRGVNFVQIPTTLLSQVDSSVGGKTAINAKAGKNLIGVFWQPRLVIADMSCLNSLDRRDILAGFAEIFKIGLINDSEFSDYCDENSAQIINENGAMRQYAIETSINAKADIVAKDERESGVRALLNLGHTFAHAIEASVNYNEQKWRHGEAVATGIAMAARFSLKIGALENDKAIKIINFIEKCGYKTKLMADIIDNATPDDLLKTMVHDKKNSNGNINLVLLKDIGHAYIHKNAPKDLLLEFLHNECEPLI